MLHTCILRMSASLIAHHVKNCALNLPLFLLPRGGNEPVVPSPSAASGAIVRRFLVSAMLLTDILHLVLGQPPRSRLDDNNCLLTKLFSSSLAAAQPLAGRRADDWSCARRLLPLRVICTSAAFALCWLALRPVPEPLFRFQVEPAWNNFNEFWSRNYAQSGSRKYSPHPMRKWKFSISSLWKLNMSRERSQLARSATNSHVLQTNESSRSTPLWKKDITSGCNMPTSLV